MTVDVEAGGALATAALAAREIDGAQGSGHGPQAKTCANCGATLVGPFCHSCGQTAHIHRSLLHIVEETLHGVLHFDTRSWHTLPLLIGRPGRLTRRYIDGQRTRYVSPLALFLFTMFLMFFALSFFGSAHPDLAVTSEAGRAAIRGQIQARIEKAEARVTERTAALQQPTTREPDELQEALDEARELLKESQGELAEFNADVAKLNAAAVPGTQTDSDNSKQPDRTVIKGAEGLSDLHIRLGYPKLDAAIKHATENPELLLYKMKNTAYKFSFMLIPISLPFLWLMFFWRRDVRMYDHAVFALYSLSFMSLLFVVVALATSVPAVDRHIGWALLIPPVHMFVHLRETYALGRFSSFWRTLALLFIAGTVFILFLVLILGLSVT